MKKTLFLVVILVVFGMAGAASGAMWVGSDELPDAKTIEAYWTPERMQSAIPYPMEIDGEPTAPDPAALEEEADAIPGSSTSSSDGRPSVLLELEEDVPDSSGIQPAGSFYPFPHTTYFVRTLVYLRFPERTIGKVFFTQHGRGYVCSGSSVGGNAVLTAGHCVSHGDGHWNSNWRFVPAYRNNFRPRGTWSARQLFAFTLWHQNGSFCRDVGFAIMRLLNGQRISARVGRLGFSWNQLRYRQHWHALGYPAASPYNGRWLVDSQSQWAKNDAPGCSNPATIGIGSNMTGGSSGGPWVRVFFPDRGGAVNYANGVNSYKYGLQPGAIYSPYFDIWARNFWAAMIGL
ncbi:MAG TPA: hypothetical protein ENI07_09545 [Desulfobacterales bacterium]|nr:hypothetical protein [Desulfobacterales bacterium]